VQTYDDYLTGNVWGFIIEDEDEENGGDSCWGFIGDTALADMKDHVSEKYHKAMDEAWENRFGA
jgi:hypothetical protein